MKKVILILIATLCFAITQAQSAFKRVPRPTTKYSIALGTTVAPITQIAWRFTVPTVGYLYTKGNSQVATSLGFGWNKLQWDTANGGNWFTKVSINGIVVGGGNIAPNPQNPASVMSIGFSVTFMKGHISIGPVYNLPTVGQPTGLGQNFGVFAMASIPLL